MLNQFPQVVYALKHKVATGWRTGFSFVKKNNVKILVILFGAYVVFLKDVSLSLNLETIDNPSQALRSSLSGLGTSPESEQPTGSLPGPANTFSNLGYVLNPSFAKEKKTSKRSVKFHEDKCKVYIEQYSEVAQHEMKKYGVPASIKLAQGLLESNAGESRLATENKNHFGIKCFSRKCKKGHCTNHSDDTHKDFFRNYDSAWESYRAHSKFLQKDRYKHLKSLGTKDYKGWAKGLSEAGYATDPKYADKLIRIIEKFSLNKYDL